MYEYFFNNNNLTINKKRSFVLQFFIYKNLNINLKIKNIKFN